jgi:hypothetical protein
MALFLQFMGMPIFLAFDYERDLCRARQVSRVWTEAGGEALGCWEKTVWDAAQLRRGQLHQLIDAAIARATATVVLVTQHTAEKKYVQYAVQQSHQLGKKLLGIYVHRIPDEHGKQAPIGHTRFGEVGVDQQGHSLFFWQFYPAYRWVIDDGPTNFPRWVSRTADGSARRDAGRPPGPQPG